MNSSADAAFTAAEYEGAYAVGMENHWWTRARADIVRRAVDRFPRLPILDIGCGPGLTVRYLR